jgi:multicomponent Na+:H+ antiporter subunit D
MLTPEERINLDIDWFYRKDRVFLEGRQLVIAPADTFWGELYRTVALKGLYYKAKLAYLFDRKVIDGAVDGTADSVRALGGVVRKMQSGRVQAYVGLSVFIFVLIIWFALKGM